MADDPKTKEANRRKAEEPYSITLIIDTRAWSMKSSQNKKSNLTFLPGFEEQGWACRNVIGQKARQWMVTGRTQKPARSGRPDPSWPLVQPSFLMGKAGAWSSASHDSQADTGCQSISLWPALTQKGERNCNVFHFMTGFGEKEFCFLWPTWRVGIVVSLVCFRRKWEVWDGRAGEVKGRLLLTSLLGYHLLSTHIRQLDNWGDASKQNVWIQDKMSVLDNGRGILMLNGAEPIGSL